MSHIESRPNVPPLHTVRVRSKDMNTASVDNLLASGRNSSQGTPVALVGGTPTRDGRARCVVATCPHAVANTHQAFHNDGRGSIRIKTC